MGVFPPHNIETMNEDDVSGELVRPFCRALGYSQGDPDANLRSQVSLQYDKIFLGHKKVEKDPVLRGRPDFVCEVVSYTRWVIESKSPSIALTIDDSYQAHTYATHPEIAAEFYVLTNGREFRLYRIASPETPLMAWMKEETDALMPALSNILGPEAMKKRARVGIDLGKPLAIGIGSAVEVVGGHVVYVKTTGSFPIPSGINGLRNNIRGNSVNRNDQGMIVASIDVQSAFVDMDEIMTHFGFYPLIFKTSDEYLSTDINRPTLMQNILSFRAPRGMTFPKTLLSPGGVLPFDVSANCYTEAVGFIENSLFRGTFAIDYQYMMYVPATIPIPGPRTFTMRTEGEFEVCFR